MAHLLTPEVTGNCIHLKDKLLAGFSREEALFLDVEATGLSHGAGTVAFLIGLGRFVGEAFVTEQLFLDDYDQEAAQLHLLLGRLEERRFLVSYNGKSFDRSILENRLVIHRLLDPAEARLRLMPHLDLLHLGRRLFAGRLADHTLGTLERSILGFFRHDDLPGALVPQVYFQFLLTRDWSLAEPVLHHNFHDVLSMVHLAHDLLARVDPQAAPEDPALAANLGRLLLAAGNPAAAARLLHRSLRLSGGQRIAALAPDLGRALRAGGRSLADQVRVWQDLETACPDSAVPAQELAKLHRRQKRTPK